jgi:putative YhbY family RNA-binding protein
MIGNDGLTPAVSREIDVNLKSHELIKIRMMGEGRETREALAHAICEAIDATVVQHIGKILVVYRPKPPEEHKAAPRRARRKAPRRTKRSYQNT